MRSPFDGRGSLTERLLRFAGALLLAVIALMAAIWFLERYGWMLLLAAVLIAAGYLAVRLVRARRDPWR